MLEEKLKKIIIEQFGSVRQFSMKIDIPYTTIDSILKRGIDNSNVSNVIKMCKALNLSVDRLVDNHEIVNALSFDNAIPIEMEEGIKIPVLGTIKAGIPMEAQQDIIDYVTIEKSLTRGGKEYFGLQISGDSMFPDYSEGEIVIFEKNDDFEMANNHDCAVMVNGDDATFKKVLINNSGIVLVPRNGGYDMTMYSNEDIEKLPVKIIGIAREKRTKV